MPFGEPILVYGLNRDPGTEFRLNVSEDELTAYVAKGAGWWIADIYAAKRASRAEPFGSLVALPSINSDAAEDSVSVTADGLTMFVESSRSGRGRIYTATRPTTADPFTSPNRIVLDQNPDDEMDVYVVPDGSALYFRANLPTSTAIYRAALRTTDPIVDGGSSTMRSIEAVGEPMLVRAGSPRFPVVSRDELTLYFGDNGSIDGYELDIWMATRSSRDVQFGDAVKLGELNTDSTDDYPQWISPDGCRLYLARGFSGGAVYQYVAERVRN